jgi:hypothetical protein
MRIVGSIRIVLGGQYNPAPWSLNEEAPWKIPGKSARTVKVPAPKMSTKRTMDAALTGDSLDLTLFGRACLYYPRIIG